MDAKKRAEKELKLQRLREDLKGWMLPIFRYETEQAIVELEEQLRDK